MSCLLYSGINYTTHVFLCVRPMQGINNNNSFKNTKIYMNLDSCAVFYHKKENNRKQAVVRYDEGNLSHYLKKWPFELFPWMRYSGRWGIGINVTLPLWSRYGYSCIITLTMCKILIKNPNHPSGATVIDLSNSRTYCEKNSPPSFIILCVVQYFCIILNWILDVGIILHIAFSHYHQHSNYYTYILQKKID